MTRYAIDTYAAFPYYKKGTADTERKKNLQGILYAIKNGGRLRRVADGQSMSAPKGFCEIVLTSMAPVVRDYLNPSVALVPLPSSTGLGLLSASQWPCLEMAQHFQAASLGTAVPAVLRKTVIPTSHRVPTEQRPGVETVADSVDVDVAALRRFPSVTLLDDVVTSGTNAVGVAIAIQRAGYRGPVRLFAAAHTVGTDGPQDGPYIGECVWISNRPRAFRP